MTGIPRVFFTFPEFVAMARLSQGMRLDVVKAIHTRDAKKFVIIPLMEVAFQLEKRGFLWREDRVSTDRWIDYQGLGE